MGLSHPLLRWERLLAHNHWFTIRVLGRELHVCARCSGTVLGFLALQVLIQSMKLLDHPIPLNLGFIVSIILALPSIVDWTTQSLGFRQSTNRLRSAAGFCSGVGVALLSLTDASLTTKFLIVSSLCLAVVTIGVVGNRMVHRLRLNVDV